MRRQSTRIWNLVKGLVKPTAKRGPRHPARRLHLEFLEDRLTPSTTNLNNLNLGVISGKVSVDTTGTVGVPGLQITLSGTTTGNQPVSLSTTTDGNGDYSFLQVQPGTYQLSRGSFNKVIDKSALFGNLGGSVSGQTVTTITLAQGQVGLNYDFLVGGLAPGAISLAEFTTNSTGTPLSHQTAGSGQAFADGLNQSASSHGTGTAALGGLVFNASTNSGIAGVQVALTGVDYFGNAFALTTNSAADGSYHFVGLQSGNYTVEVSQLPAGYRSGAAAAGSLGGISPLNTQITGIQVGAGQNGTNYNFAEIPSGAPTSGPGPALVAELADDTGASATDGITSDPTIQGSVHALGTLAGLVATLDGGSAKINLLSLVNGGSTFLLNTAALDQAEGGKLANGAHTVTITAGDSQGHTSTVSVSFTLVRSTNLQAPTLDFGGSLGDMGTDVHVAKQVASSSYTIVGTAVAGSTVELLGLGLPLSTTADSSGKFSFSNVTLTSIINELTAVVLDKAGNFASHAATFVLDSNPTASTIAPQQLQKTNTAGTTLDLSNFFTAPATTDTTIQYNTSSGAIRVDLFNALAPNTVSNFLDYANSTTANKSFTNSIFDRLIPNFVLQGGSFNFDPTTNTLSALSANPSINTEANRPGAKTNVTGTLAMALPSGTNGQQYNVNGATSAYFFNLVDNPSLNGPFTVFGQVIDGQSMRVINSLSAIPTVDESNFSGALANVPLQNYSGFPFPTGATSSNFAFISSISTTQASQSVGLTFNASGYNSNVINVSVSGSTLTIKPASSTASGTTTIFVSATDKFGLTTQTSIQVTVS
jgi:cyclophilin family peptidyl-prolyl cis-trans isomerase